MNESNKLHCFYSWLSFCERNTVTHVVVIFFEKKMLGVLITSWLCSFWIFRLQCSIPIFNVFAHQFTYIVIYKPVLKFISSLKYDIKNKTAH